MEVAEDGPLVEWVAVGVEREEGDAQGGEAPEISGPALDPVVPSVAEEKDPDRAHGADEYVPQYGVVVAAHVVLDLDTEDQPPDRPEHDRQQQADRADGASNAQVGHHQGARAFQQLLDRRVHSVGPTSRSGETLPAADSSRAGR